MTGVQIRELHHRVKGEIMAWQCDRCYRWVPGGSRHDCLMDEFEKLQEEIAASKSAYNVLASTEEMVRKDLYAEMNSVRSEFKAMANLHKSALELCDNLTLERDKLKAEIERFHDKYDLQLLVKQNERYRTALEIISKMGEQSRNGRKIHGPWTIAREALK